MPGRQIADGGPFGRIGALYGVPAAAIPYSVLISPDGTVLSVGHSLIVVEHNLQLMRAADYLIDLGPGAGEAGGRIVVQGTPEEVARCGESHTGRYLATSLAPALSDAS